MVGQLVGESHVGDKSQGFISISAPACRCLGLGVGPEAAVFSVTEKGKMNFCLPVAGTGWVSFQVVIPRGKLISFYL